MPVWRDLTKELRKSGELNVVGIVQEQHPDRTRLYAAWQDLDFPILWDPFNTTGVDFVLVSSFVDGYGIVQATGLSPRNGEKLEMLLNKDWSPPGEEKVASAPWITPAMGLVRIAHPPGSIEAAKAAMSRFLWPADGTIASKTTLDNMVTELEKRLERRDAYSSDHFRAGVARRLRLDSEHATKDDGQAAIDHWVQALTLNPNQYIWRRRIQQWGPRLDKPYPFYDWVDGAFKDLKDRGHAHAPLRAPLSGSEVAGKGQDSKPADSAQTQPDPKGKVTLDKGLMARIESSSAPHSKIANKGGAKGKKSARVHLTLRPLGGNHWSGGTDPATVWLALPEGWTTAQNGLTFGHSTDELSSVPVYLDFEVKAPMEATSGALKGYVLYSICKPDGVCLFRRQNFTVDVKVDTKKSE